MRFIADVQTKFREQPLIAIVILLSLILVLAVALLFITLADGAQKKLRSASAELNAAFAPLPIDPNEIYLPTEPDFLPEVILSRSQRSVWTTEDIAPFGLTQLVWTTVS
ncbi:hypothetical protein MASR2M78_18000 [Treponema sp.]